VALHGEGFVLPVVFRKLLGEKARDEAILSFAEQFRELSTIYFKIRPYAIPLLARLRSEHYRLALVSNTEAILTNYDLDHCGLRDYFDEIVLSSEVGVAKPDPEILNRALRSISVPSSHAVFVGDTLETDLRAAEALRIPCVLISSDPKANSASRDLPVMLVKPSLHDIYAALTRLLT
jgi:putative hydrolase of the HAD superfamily